MYKTTNVTNATNESKRIMITIYTEITQGWEYYKVSGMNELTERSIWNTTKTLSITNRMNTTKIINTRNTRYI